MNLQEERRKIEKMLHGKIDNFICICIFCLYILSF